MKTEDLLNGAQLYHQRLMTIFEHLMKREVHLRSIWEERRKRILEGPERPEKAAVEEFNSIDHSQYVDVVNTMIEIGAMTSPILDEMLSHKQDAETEVELSEETAEAVLEDVAKGFGVGLS